MTFADANNRFTGARASPGRAMGPYVWIDFSSAQPRQPGLGEADALRMALEAAKRELSALGAKVEADAAECLEFQLALIEDQDLIGPVLEGVMNGAAADFCWRRALDRQIAEIRADPSEYVRARAVDLADLRDRVLQSLRSEAPTMRPPLGAVIGAEDLPPSRFLEIDWSGGGGVALTQGSSVGHTAILARARSVPMVVQIGKLPAAELALLDADQGFVELDPSDDQKRTFQSRGAKSGARKLTAYPSLESSRAGYRGEPVRLLINIEGPDSLSHPAAQSADGVGLMRTEFLYRPGEGPPCETTQLRAYEAVLAWAGERPVTIRTMDAGGDKPVPGLSEVGEANPFLGVRGLRLSLRRPDVFRVQLRALGRAAVIGNLRVMFPMVTVPREFEAARALFHEVVGELKREGLEAAVPELGVMVETPAAALTIADFAASFFSIGSNDLAQYVTACDRTNGRLGDLYDPLNPGVLALVRQTVEHGRRQGLATSLCGDIAGDPQCLPVLLECGLRELSMAPACLAGVKQALRDIEAEDRFV